MKNVTTNDSSKIVNYANKYSIPQKNSFIIDTTYISYVYSLDSSLNQIKKNHLQPLQALYFNKTGKLISYHINCYTGGFPNLKWNRNGVFDSFPPKTQAPLDTIFTYNDIRKFVKDINDDKNAEYNILVFWNIAMGRQSKRLIKIVNENAKLADKSINIIYVNDDDIFLK